MWSILPTFLRFERDLFLRRRIFVSDVKTRTEKISKKHRIIERICSRMAIPLSMKIAKNKIVGRVAHWRCLSVKCREVNEKMKCKKTCFVLFCTEYEIKYKISAGEHVLLHFLCLSCTANALIRVSQFSCTFSFCTAMKNIVSDPVSCPTLYAHSLSFYILLRFVLKFLLHFLLYRVLQKFASK